MRHRARTHPSGTLRPKDALPAQWTHRPWDWTSKKFPSGTRRHGIVESWAPTNTFSATSGFEMHFLSYRGDVLGLWTVASKFYIIMNQTRAKNNNKTVRDKCFFYYIKAFYLEHLQFLWITNSSVDSIYSTSVSSGGSFTRTLLSANPAQRSSRTGPPVYIGWSRVTSLLHRWEPSWDQPTLFLSHLFLNDIF
jgi:hypothetical protein